MSVREAGRALHLRSIVAPAGALLVSAVHSLALTGPDQAKPIWSSVYRELRNFSRILPLLSQLLGMPWGKIPPASPQREFGWISTVKQRGKRMPVLCIARCFPRSTNKIVVLWTLPIKKEV